MSQQYPNSSDPQPVRAPDYSRYLSDGTERVQTACGAIIFFLGFAGWYPVAHRLPFTPLADTPRNLVLMQTAWVAVCLAALLTVDLLARSRWGWDRFRVGLILGFFALTGFWIARTAIAWYLA